MFNLKKVFLAATLTALLLASLAPAPADACTTGGGGPIIIPHGNGNVWLIWPALLTANATQMEACLAGIATANGIIDRVIHVALVETESGKMFPGYEFTPHKKITNRLAQITGLRDGQWQGFFAYPKNPPAANIEAELHFDLILAPGATVDDLARALQTEGLIANGSASYKALPDFHHFSIHRPHDIVVVDEDGEIRIVGKAPRNVE